MVKNIFKGLNLIALLGSIAWLVSSWAWEPFILFITLLSSFIVLIFQRDNNDIINADRNLFEKFNNDLPPYNVVYIKDTSLKSTFLIRNLDPFFNFIVLWKDVHHTYLNKKIEKKKKKLYESIDEFTALVAANTFSTHNANHHKIPIELEQTNKEKYDDICRKIDESQDRVVEDYNDFGKSTRNILKV